MNNQEFELDLQPIPEAGEQERSFAQDLYRGKERFITRAAETVAGLPGDVVDSIKAMASFLPGVAPDPEKATFVQRAGQSLLGALPRSSELRAVSAEHYPELEPESEIEEVQDQFVEDFTTLLVPLGGQTVSVAKALGLSALGNLGAEVAKSFDVGEGGQDAAKLGLMMFGGMFGKGRGINKYISDLYKKSDKLAKLVPEVRYSKNIFKNIESNLSKGSVTPGKASTYKLIDDMKGKISNGVMGIEDALEFDRNINNAYGMAYNDKEARRYLSQLKSAHSRAMDGYVKDNPSFGEPWKEAKLAFSGMKSSQAAQDFIKKNSNLRDLSHSMAILGMADYVTPGGKLLKLGTAGAGLAAVYSAEVAKRFAKNPALRRYYQNVMKASLSENTSMLARNLKGLERAAKKEFETNPLPELDLREIEE